MDDHDRMFLIGLAWNVLAMVVGGFAGRYLRRFLPELPE